MFSLRLRRNNLGTDRLLRSGAGGGGGRGLGLRRVVQFSRTGLLCKSCQTILRLKQIHVSFKRRQKNTLWRFFVSNKMLSV